MQRLLVLEDEPGIGTVVSRALSSARFQIDCAADGRSGLEMARSGHHDLVLLDLMRAALDGVGSAGLTVKVGRRTPRGTFTPTVKATSGSIAHQATTKLTVK
jgi:two-component system, OmpR family, copper resistance phosphate regulon response regulator CusR